MAEEHIQPPQDEWAIEVTLPSGDSIPEVGSIFF
jgi:hypothetical protein